MSNPTIPRGYHDEPKRGHSRVPIELDKPKDDLITYRELSKCDGTDLSRPVLVAIKGTVFDVTRNAAYGSGGPYHVFAGKDPSRALAISSLKPEDCVPEWHDLEDKHKTILDEWYTYFSQCYNIMGKVAGAKNLDP
ncbi:uncharacterized protein Z518_07018 [Rhinocladiella mackenziei CBS 650.93]|uniref:Cytochrome b5 heme-binding domain-containing protein n=1 Tax=Rhinocladiella mackenziei CBS 650.93 TaxID=1442369 RepID=A0A0D2IJP1_9EURO|nr:uncharacterized protein Z518_07018 [Rhinocladiella mackenziei CBS 650.93]KIX03466.1 hypothetical protein Z518_07018 [Rhinocladiella mackenziei CBS 650.93]